MLSNILAEFVEPRLRPAPAAITPSSTAPAPNMANTMLDAALAPASLPAGWMTASSPEYQQWWNNYQSANWDPIRGQMISGVAYQDVDPLSNANGNMAGWTERGVSSWAFNPDTAQFMGLDAAGSPIPGITKGAIANDTGFFNAGLAALALPVAWGAATGALGAGGATGATGTLPATVGGTGSLTAVPSMTGVGTYGTGMAESIAAMEAAASGVPAMASFGAGAAGAAAAAAAPSAMPSAEQAAFYEANAGAGAPVGKGLPFIDAPISPPVAPLSPGPGPVSSPMLPTLPGSSTPVPWDKLVNTIPALAALAAVTGGGGGGGGSNSLTSPLGMWASPALLASLWSMLEANKLSYNDPSMEAVTSSPGFQAAIHGVKRSMGGEYLGSGNLADAIARKGYEYYDAERAASRQKTQLQWQQARDKASIYSTALSAYLLGNSGSMNPLATGGWVDSAIGKGGWATAIANWLKGLGGSSGAAPSVGDYWSTDWSGTPESPYGP